MDVSKMTSSEKMDILMRYDDNHTKLKITTLDGKSYQCMLEYFAEDEEDWAYDIKTLDDPPRYFTIECGFISSVKVLNN